MAPDVFVASNIPHPFPRKLQKPSTVRDSVRDTAETFIMDSGIGNDELDNRDILDLAHEHDAKYVVAKDYLHDQARTTDSIRVFCQEYQSHPCEATPMIPLQPPHAEHYKQVPGHECYVLGGMIPPEVTTQQRVAWIRDFDRVAPKDCHTHALGIGGGKAIIEEFAGTGILDSVDCATPEMAAINGAVVTDDIRQKMVMAFGGGEGKRKRTAPLSAFNAWQIQDAWHRAAEPSDAEQLDMANWVES